MPRMTQISVLTSHFSGLKRLIEPKLKIKPSGRAKSSVSANSSSVFPKPSNRLTVTVQNINYNLFFHRQSGRKFQKLSATGL